MGAIPPCPAPGRVEAPPGHFGSGWEYTASARWPAAWTAQHVGSDASLVTKPAQKPDLALAHALRAIREEKGLAREAVAYEAKISTGSLARIELGQSVPTWVTVRALAAALNVTLRQLGARVEAEGLRSVLTTSSRSSTVRHPWQTNVSSSSTSQECVSWPSAVFPQRAHAERKARVAMLPSLAARHSGQMRPPPRLPIDDLWRRGGRSRALTSCADWDPGASFDAKAGSPTTSLRSGALRASQSPSPGQRPRLAGIGAR